MQLLQGDLQDLREDLDDVQDTYETEIVSEWRGEWQMLGAFSLLHLSPLPSISLPFFPSVDFE